MNTATEVLEETEASAVLDKINRMSRSELLEDILRHEKEVHGIDWLSLYAQGPSGRAEAKRLARVYLVKLQSELKIPDEDLPEITKAFLAGADVTIQTMPEWAVDRKGADEWRNASGDELRDKVEKVLKVMQTIEISSSDLGIARLMEGIAVVALFKKMYDLYKAARVVAGVLESILTAVRGVTVNVTTTFVATVVVAVIADIILNLMEKDAAVYMVLLNMTDDELELEGTFLQHGNQIVQFQDIDDKNILAARDVLKDEHGVVLAEAYWLGLFSASKKELALFGTLGALQFKRNSTFPGSLYVGWEVTLTGVFGGPNRCLVSVVPQASLETFTEVTNDHGSLLSSGSTGRAIATTKMHSGTGSFGYMSVVCSVD